MDDDEHAVPHARVQRMQKYRERIRDKLLERGVPGEKLERRTDEIFHRKLDLDLKALIA